MKDKSQRLEYIVTIRPGYIHDIEGLLKEIKDQYEEFEYIIERASAQTVRSEYILGITPSNFKLLKEKIYILLDIGSISPIIALALIRKNEDNLILVRIDLDKKDMEVFLTHDILENMETGDIENELTEIHMLIRQ
jgi:hypothetical protein